LLNFLPLAFLVAVGKAIEAVSQAGALSVPLLVVDIPYNMWRMVLL